VSVESLGAEFLGAYDNPHGLTPNLDRLSRESLWFSAVYATGNRTVRGLEALSLALPPSPGQSIVRRPGNENLFSLGSVFEDKGYAVLFAYGGSGQVRECVGGGRRAPLRPGARRDRPRARGRTADIRARDDHEQSPALYVPAGSHRHPLRDRARRRGQVQRLCDRALSRAGATAPLVRGYAVRDHRRPRRQRARHHAHPG